MKFIKTKNINIANYLREKKFKELPKEGELFVFINNSFNNKDLNFNKSEVIYTNNLFV